MRATMIRSLSVVAVLAVVALLGGCSQTVKSGEPTNTGILTGYELGNEQDFVDQRKDRLTYREFE